MDFIVYGLDVRYASFFIRTVYGLDVHFALSFIWTVYGRDMHFASSFIQTCMLGALSYGFSLLL